MVVDSSFVVALMVAEEHSPFAERIMDTEADVGLEAPMLIGWDLANVLQTKVRRGQLSTEDRRRLLGRLEELPVLLHPATTTPELRAVAELCDRRGLTAYDAAYLALGLQLGAPLATLDARLAKAARAEGLAVHCPF